MTKRAKLRQEAHELVEHLVETDRVSGSDADLFLRVMTVKAAFDHEAERRERERRKALPWWKR